MDNGLGLAAAFFHGHEADPDIPPDVTGLAGLYTGNDSSLGAVFHEGAYLDGNLRYVGALAYASVNLDLFGSGFRAGYNIEGVFTLHNARYRLGTSDFYFGGRWDYLASTVAFDAPGLPPGVGGKDLNADMSGLGLSLYYDSRDNAFSPQEGVFARALITVNDPAWGSDYSFLRYHFTGFGYHSPAEKWRLAV